jgi:L-amino acid N-acyltransferase YncA
MRRPLTRSYSYAPISTPVLFKWAEPVDDRISRFGRVAIARRPSGVENTAMNKEAVVRGAAPGDAAAICKIYNAALEERGSTFETAPRSPADFQPRIEDSRFPLLVSNTNEGIAGWAGLAPYSTRECYSGIGEASVYVAPRARGHGLGTLLTEALAAAAEKRGFHKMIGKLFTDNAASIRLVERCGFDSVGMHRRHGRLDGAWRDVLVVERLLG